MNRVHAQNAFTVAGNILHQDGLSVFTRRTSVPLLFSPGLEPQRPVPAGISRIGTHVRRSPGAEPVPTNGLWSFSAFRAKRQPHHRAAVF